VGKHDFLALVLEEQDGKVVPGMKHVADEQLPQGDVTVRVRASTLNYKDGMILKGIGRMVRRYPHIPGVDFAGVVEASDSADFRPGDEVILTGWRVGETHWGGYAQKARVKSDWLVKLPDGLTVQRAMAIGTAGFTSMLAVMALEAHGLTPEIEGEVLVTGAAGGVGSVAVAILAHLGYRVAASTGRPAEHDYLCSLGAATIIERSELSTPPARPLLSERWSGAIDSVGGTTLATILASLWAKGAVAACGLAGANDVTTSLMPFLLRGVSLVGIDSVMCPKATRIAAWNRLVHDLPAEKLDAMTSYARLRDLPILADKILHGQVRGRLVIDLDDIGDIGIERLAAE
jgi:acrylyl-CoA reductase (NADPH)